jgi:hypothetical protein
LRINEIYFNGVELLLQAEQVTELKQSELRLMRQIQTLNTEEPGSRKEVLFMSAQLDFFTQEV